MQRLIDKRCAIKHLKELLKNSIMPTEWYEGAKSAITLLQKEPTVDAEPVKQERCEFCKDGKTFLGAVLVLGNDGNWHSIRYCPNCGAKMDEEGS